MKPVLQSRRNWEYKFAVMCQLASLSGVGLVVLIFDLGMMSDFASPPGPSELYLRALSAMGEPASASCSVCRSSRTDDLHEGTFSLYYGTLPVYL